jgi:phospholipid/cholesterol/gamma-HCH transport system ATP-binding protein
MIGLEPSDSGSVTFDGQEITRLSERQLARCAAVAMLFQSGALFDSLALFDNVAYPLRERRELDEDQVAAKVRETLAMVRLEGAEAKLPAELSGGMRSARRSPARWWWNPKPCCSTSPPPASIR